METNSVNGSTKARIGVRDFIPSAKAAGFLLAFSVKCRVGAPGRPRSRSEHPQAGGTKMTLEYEYTVTHEYRGDGKRRRPHFGPHTRAIQEGDDRVREPGS
jgi:hypothetical protein